MTALMVDLPEDMTEDEARLMLALKLFETHRVSMGKAAHMAGKSMREFIDILGQHKISIFHYEPGELEREMNM